MRFLTSLGFVSVLALGLLGCGSEPPVVEGDNPAAKDAVTADPVAAGRGDHVLENNNAVGAGRGASAPVPPPTDDSLTQAK
jgi:hypothetical protein